MGCVPSKPATRRPSWSLSPSIQPYKGPKEFRASAMPERKPQYQPYRPPKDVHTSALPERSPQYQPYRPPEDVHTGAMPEQNWHRRAPQMYQTYQEQDQQRAFRESRRYSWEGHPSEKVFTTFEKMAERGIISKDALKKR